MKLVPAKTLVRIWRALPAQFGSVVGEEAKLGQAEVSREWEPSGKRYYAELELVEPRVTKLWMVFALPLAITCAGKLMVRPNGAIRDNVSSSTFDGDDLDAMGECVNTFCAAVNDAVRADLGDDHRIVFRRGSLEPPPLEGLGALSLASARLELGELAKAEFQLVVPDDLFVAAVPEEGSEGDEDDDEDEADDEDEDGDDDASSEAAGEPGRAKKSKRAKGKSKKKRSRSSDGAGADDGDAGDRPLLTPEELAAIREATRAGMARGATMIVAPRAAVREQWRESLAALEIEAEFVADHHQLLAICRTREVTTIVVDADACASGGLTILAALRGKSCVPARRVVVASRPTQTHLVACLGGGASDYLCRPLDPEVLRRVLCVE